MSIGNLTYKIKNIYPYGSITQLTQNITSDYEMSIITQNYSTINNEQIITLFNEIQSYIVTNYKNDYKIISIRETKRTAARLESMRLQGTAVGVGVESRHCPL